MRSAQMLFLFWYSALFVELCKELSLSIHQCRLWQQIFTVPISKNFALKCYLKGKECLCLQCFSKSSFWETGRLFILSFLYEIQTRKPGSFLTNILIKKVLLKNLILIHSRWRNRNSTACGYSIKQTLATPVPNLKLWWMEENESWKGIIKDLKTKQTFPSIQPRCCLIMSSNFWEKYMFNIYKKKFLNKKRYGLHSSSSGTVCSL